MSDNAAADAPDDNQLPAVVLGADSPVAEAPGSVVAGLPPAGELPSNDADGTESQEGPAAGDRPVSSDAVLSQASDAELAEDLPPESKRKWYAIKVQSGREDTIKAAILRKIAIEGLEDVFGQIMVPIEKVIEKKAVKVKDKKTGEYNTVERKVERKVKKFQGYIFAELEFNDRLLYLIRETSGVGDFLKLRPRPNDTPVPEPMSDSEVKQMLGEKVGPEKGPTKVKVDFEKGDRVRIKEGSFKDSEGDVKEVILPKDPTDPPKVIVTVTFWGRPLDVELEYWQVAKA
ncbi:hypothetical protein R5W23_000286 [Gemmata sp. JC673]|uniref:Transcription termination/antitermination protein NusG n=1 Tax=Gemmata algarum TaxID=2975278 RepID=A0ABU5EW89_9BACT|nr:transcription termination/antitermination protein NusG [Gemmata algarum]MDY3557981.1 hypothetical protein [Gemmata algarum]